MWLTNKVDKGCLVQNPTKQLVVWSVAWSKTIDNCDFGRIINDILTKVAWSKG